jgi:hypothetical protein
MSTLPGCPWMNDCAARRAAASRLGATSVAAMLPDASIARMTVPADRGTGTEAAGPATPTASTAIPATLSHAPVWRAGRAAVTPAAASAPVRRIHDTQCDDLVPPRQLVQRAFPVADADEVRDDNNETPAPGQSSYRLEHGREIRRSLPLGDDAV